MIDSNETTAYENGRDAGYAEGYEDGLKNTKGFIEENFLMDELRILRLAFELVDKVIESNKASNYYYRDSSSLVSLKEKLKIDGIV